MEEDRALAVAVELDMRGVSCRLERDAKSDYHLRVALPCDREAMWDLHGDLLEARVLQAGAPVGFVPLPVPIELSDQSLAELIAVQRYEQLSTSSRSGSLADPAQRRRRRHGASRRRVRPVCCLLLAILVAPLVLYLLDGRT